MKKVLIVQRHIPHYRRPVYDELSKYYEVTVLHSGPPCEGEGALFREIVTPARSFGPLRWQSAVIREIRSGTYSAAVAMFDIRWVMNVAAPFVCGRCRLLYWGHGYSERPLANSFRDFLMCRAAGVILYSEAARQRALANGVPASKLFVAPNTMVIDNHADGSAAEKETFIFSGRLQARKKVGEFIRAFAEVVPLLPPHVRIDIVGSGPELEALQSLAAACGLSERVTFHGTVLDADVLRPLFHRAIAYVSPGPVGLGVLHSFAYGLPVVTNHAGRHGPEFGDIADGENGLLYHTVEDLKKILVDLFADRARAAELGRNAYAFFVNERSLERMVAGYRDAIDNTRASQ